MAIVATHVAAVQELYVAYFGRPADPAGLDYWTNVVAANEGSTAAVSATFAASPEYIVTFYGKTNTQIVDQIYTNLFNRPADATGRAYWVDLLDKGTIKVDTIVAEVAAAALTTDAERVENKVAAATAFTAALDTPAEVAGYGNFDAITEAKKFIAGITTDASLTSALTPATLNASVAAVVKAGTPFALESGVAALRAADKGMADFIKANNLNPADPLLSIGDQVDALVTTAATALNVQAPGYTAAPTAGQKAAVLADRQKKVNDDLTAANKDLSDARTAAGAKVVAAVDSQVRAQTALDQALTAQVQAAGALTTAEAVFESATKGVVSYTPAGISFTAVGATTATPLINIDAKTGVSTLATGVTEATNPGVTALLNAARADAQADLTVGGATAAFNTAKGIVDGFTDTATAKDATNAAAIIKETGDQVIAQAAVTDLAKAVANLATANSLDKQYDALVKAVETANADFTAAGYLAPEALDDAFTPALTGSDVFTLGNQDAVTVTNFGVSGDDVIFVGKNFTLNTGAVSTGVDTAMEIFFVQNGGNAEVHVEKAAYGSTQGDVIVISLVGVDATDLQLTDGVISLKDGAA